MGNTKIKLTINALALGLAIGLSPAAQAGGIEISPSEPSRNTGVGQVIAQQGNEALRAIRAELAARVRAVMPKLPAAPKPAPAAAVVKMSQPAGAGVADAAGVALDE